MEHFHDPTLLLALLVFWNKRRSKQVFSYCIQGKKKFRLAFDTAALLTANALIHILNDQLLFARSSPSPPPSVVAEESGLPFAPAVTTEPFLKALALDPSQPSPLHNLLKSHLQRGDHTACAETFWTHWAGIRGYRPPTRHPSETDGASPDGYGDGWAWGAWRGRNARSVAGIVEIAASCFAGLGR